MPFRKTAWLRNRETQEDNALKPGVYSWVAPTVVDVHRVIITLEDERVSTDGYGRLPELENGINLYVEREDGLFESLLEYDPEGLYDNSRITRTFDWAQYCYDVTIIPTGPTKIVEFRYSFDKAGAPVKLCEGDIVAVDFADDLYRDGRGLITHKFNIQYVDLL